MVYMLTYLWSTVSTSLLQVFVPDDRWKPGPGLELVNIACEVTQIALFDRKQATSSCAVGGVKRTFVWVVELEDVGSGRVVWQHHHPSSNTHLLTGAGFILWQTPDFGGWNWRLVSPVQYLKSHPATLQQCGFRILDWSLCSADLPPTENVWNLWTTRDILEVNLQIIQLHKDHTIGGSTNGRNNCCCSPLRDNTFLPQGVTKAQFDLLVTGFITAAKVVLKQLGSFKTLGIHRTDQIGMYVDR